MQNESLTDFTKEIAIPKSMSISKPVTKTSIENNSIYFNHSQTWIMKIENGKIIFNTKEFPDLTADDFSKKIIDILELHIINYYR